MQYRPLGNTDIKVSEICLGTMTYGEQNTEKQAHEQLDYAVDQGINFIDTAEMYAVPPRPETQGKTEQYIGTWLAKGNRDKVVVATKVAGRSPMTWLRDGEHGTQLNRPNIEEAVNKSLKRLQTDYIDLYQLHWPDRPINLFGAGSSYQHTEHDSNPIEETLSVLADLVQAGKIRSIGLSNETPWGVAGFISAADRLGLPKVVSIQNAYNLLNRLFELGLSEFAHREQVGLLAYSPLAQGYLSGKYQNGKNPEGSRKQLFDRLQRYENPQADQAINQYLDLAAEQGLDPNQMALAFVTSRPFVTSNIIGATTMAQLKLNIDSANVLLDETTLKAIEAIHLQCPNPCP